MTMDHKQQRDLARLLAALRRDGRQQSGLDAALVPPDKDTAYRIARLVEEELGWQVAGWKIAAAKEEMQQALRTDLPYLRPRLPRPASMPRRWRCQHARQCSPIPEVEYQARLGADLPPRATPYTMEEVSEAVASLHPGIELAECRFVHDDKFPPLAVRAGRRRGQRHALPTAPPIDDWRTPRHRGPGGGAVVQRRGPVARGTAAAALDHPIGVPLAWLANELSRTGIGMKAGQMISTGTLTGMLRPKAGETYVADFGPLWSRDGQLRVKATLTASPP